MRILDRHIAREVLTSIAVVLAGLLVLFAFFDMLRELGDLQRTRAGFGVLLVYILLSLPAHVYELAPIAALIGAIFALTMLATHSEFVVMRVSGMSSWRVAGTLGRVGLVLALATFAFGEYVSPHSERLAQQLKLRAAGAPGALVAHGFLSGAWIKDEGSFINVRRVLADTSLSGVRIYQFDAQHRLQAISEAAEGDYLGGNRWALKNVMQTRFDETGVSVHRLPELQWSTVLNPDILAVLLVNPEQMSVTTLYAYVQHLRENRQKVGRYEAALWGKLTYPLTVVVMLLLALPFAYFNRRAGGVGGRIFAGIMLGLGFYLVSRLSSNLGAINDWPGALSAGLPTVVFLFAAAAAIGWLERR